MGSLKLYFTIGVIVAIGLALWGWTSWNRDNATTIAEGAAVTTTVTTTDKVQGIKNEIRKRPVSDVNLLNRVRAGTW